MAAIDDDMQQATQGRPPIYRVPSVPEGVGLVLRRLWVVLLVAAVGSAAAFYVSRRFSPSFESRAKIRLKRPSKVSVSSGENQEQHNLQVDPLELSQRLFVRLTSKKVLEEMVGSLAAQFPPAQLKDRKKLIGALAKKVSLLPVGGHIYQLTIRSKDPKLARAMASYLTAQLISIHRSGFEQQARRQESFALEQVKEASGALIKLEHEMVVFLEKNPAMKIRSLQSDEILSLRSGDRLRVRNRPSVYSRSLATLARKNPKLKALADRKRRLQSELQSLTQRGSSATAALNLSLTEAKNQLAQLRTEGKKDSHPLAKRALARVRKLEQKIAAASVGAKTANTEYLTRVREDLRQVGLEIRKELRGLSKSVARPSRQNLAELEANWSRLRRRYTQLSQRLTKHQEVAVNATLKKNLMVYEAKKTASIMERPLVPGKPVGLTPNVIAAAGGVMSLLFGLVLALGLGFLDIRLREPEEVSEGGWGLEVLAVLAKHRGGSLRSAAPVRSQDLVLSQDTSPARPADGGGLQGEATVHWQAGEATDPADTMVETEPMPVGSQGPTSASGWIAGESSETRLYSEGRGPGPGGLQPMDTDITAAPPVAASKPKAGWVDGLATVMDTVGPDFRIPGGDDTMIDVQSASDQQESPAEGLLELHTADIVAQESEPESEPKERSGWLDQPTQFHDHNAPRKLGGDAAAVEANPYAEEAPLPDLRVYTLPAEAALAPGLFVSSDRNGKAAEQMRLLAGQLQGRNDAYRRVFAVTSWEPGVGKTTVAANLAMAMAESQRRVLCIDACPGGAVLTGALGLELDGVDLCQQLQRWLDGSSDPWEVVQVADTLSVMPAGARARPVFPLLSSQALERLIYDMLQIFDIIVLDTKALAEASDAVALQQVVDGFVMVVARRRSNRRGLAEATSRLDARRILGVVFNER